MSFDLFLIETLNNIYCTSSNNICMQHANKLGVIAILFLLVQFNNSYSNGGMFFCI